MSSVQTALRLIEKASRVTGDIIAAFAPVLMSAAELAALASGANFVIEAVKKTYAVGSLVVEARGRYALSPLMKQLLEASIRANFIARRIAVLASQADALDACLDPETVEAAAGVFAELTAFLVPLIPQGGKSASVVERVRRGLDAFVFPEKHLTVLAALMNRLNSAFLAVLTDAVVVLGYASLRPVVGGTGLDAGFVEVALQCGSARAAAAQAARRDKRERALTDAEAAATSALGRRSEAVDAVEVVKAVEAVEGVKVAGGARSQSPSHSQSHRHRHRHTSRSRSPRLQSHKEAPRMSAVLRSMTRDSLF